MEYRPLTPEEQVDSLGGVTREADNRDRLRRAVPTGCPVCDAEIVVEEVESYSWDAKERTRWLSLDWWCSQDRDHDVGAPIAIG